MINALQITGRRSDPVRRSVSDGECVLRIRGPTAAGRKGQRAVRAARHQRSGFVQNILIAQPGQRDKIARGAEVDVIILRIKAVPPPRLFVARLSIHQTGPKRRVHAEMRHAVGGAFRAEIRPDRLRGADVRRVFQPGDDIARDNRDACNSRNRPRSAPSDPNWW